MSDHVPHTREVFISYSSKNKKWADAACAVLEKHRIRCWIAPRDIIHGTEWGAAIIEGIEACKIMVVIFSADANASSHVRREVERAIGKGLTVLPFRIENVSPNGAMEYALSSTHWLDGFTPPLERQLEALAGSVAALLAGVSSTKTVDPVWPDGPTWQPMVRLLLKAGIAAIALAVGVWGSLVLLSRVPAKVAENVSKNPSGPSDVPAVVKTEPEQPSQSPPPKPSQPPPKKPDDNGTKGTGELEVGAIVRVKIYTNVYYDDGAERRAAFVDVGQKGEVVKLPKNKPHCQVRFDPPLNRDLWISREALGVE